jgi:hypothetical protein
LPTIEGKQAGLWIDSYVKKAGKLEGVMKAVRALVKKTVKGSEEYVNPWKIPSIDSDAPLCCFMGAPGLSSPITFSQRHTRHPLAPQSIWYLPASHLAGDLK